MYAGPVALVHHFQEHGCDGDTSLNRVADVSGGDASSIR